MPADNAEVKLPNSDPSISRDRSLLVVDHSHKKRRYSLSHEKKKTGASYTPERLARFLAAEMVKAAAIRPNQCMRLFDPAVGEGELLVSLTEELLCNGHKKISVQGFDTDGDALRIAERRIREVLPPGAQVKFFQEDFLDHIEIGRASCRERV